MKEKCLRYPVLVLAALLVLESPNGAYPFTLTVWQNYPPSELVDELGLSLSMGCYVQLIWDSAGDGIDELPVNFQIRYEWLVAGCPPVDDDVFVQVAGPTNVTTTINVIDGYFYEHMITPINPALKAGEKLYTRFFTAPEDQLACWEWYGETGLWEVPVGEEFSYIIYTGQYYRADTRICVPEPSVLLLMGCSLILLLLKLRRR